MPNTSKFSDSVARMGGNHAQARIMLMKRHTIPVAVTFSALLAFAGGAVGQDAAETAERQPIIVADLGPQVGEQVPDFALTDQFGDAHDLESIMGPNGAMLLFHRSADW